MPEYFNSDIIKCINPLKNGDSNGSYYLSCLCDGLPESNILSLEEEEEGWKISNFIFISKTLMLLIKACVA